MAHLIFVFLVINSCPFQSAMNKLKDCQRLQEEEKMEVFIKFSFSFANCFCLESISFFLEI